MEVSGRRESDSSSRRKQNVKSEFVCQPCHGEGENVPAEGYCETCNECLCTSCLKVHRKLSATKNHVINSKDEMPRMQRMQNQTDPFLELCASHKPEIVKFYCQGHDTVGCGDCMILNHKSCDVHFVSDISSYCNVSKELLQIKQNIDVLEREFSSRQYEIKCDVKEATEEMKNKIIEEIKQFREEVNRYLDQAQEELLKKVEILNDENISLLNRFQIECRLLEKEIKELKSKLYKNSDKINQLFVVTKLTKKKVQLCQENADIITSRFQVNYLKFKPSKELTDLAKKRLPLGILTRDSKKYTNLRVLARESKIFPAQRQKCITDPKANFIKKMDAQDVDEGECYITGLAKISCDEIVLADSHNSSLKILNTKDNKIVSKYRLQSSPWDVTMINQATVAATLPTVGRILFINIANGQTQNHSLKVRIRCFGIDHSNGLIAVSFCSPSAIQVLNTKGNILYEVTRMFAWPSYIALSANCKTMYVSDYHNQSVYELTIDGHLKATYEGEDMSRPRGVAIRNDGNIVVCCPDQSDTASMIKSSTGEILNLSVLHVQKPFSLLLCEDQSKMYICEYNRSADKNCVKMFYLK